MRLDFNESKANSKLKNWHFSPLVLILNLPIFSKQRTWGGQDCKEKIPCHRVRLAVWPTTAYFLVYLHIRFSGLLYDKYCVAIKVLSTGSQLLNSLYFDMRGSRFTSCEMHALWSNWPNCEVVERNWGSRVSTCTWWQIDTVEKNLTVLTMTLNVTCVRLRWWIPQSTAVFAIAVLTVSITTAAGSTLVLVPKTTSPSSDSSSFSSQWLWCTQSPM